MKLSVIIPCYNAAATIAAQLEALANQDWSRPWEVIIVDNRSTDESMHIVEQYRNRLPNLRIIDASDRQGQPYALNIGIQAAMGEALAFCDADDEVGQGWVAAMGEALGKHDFVACRMDTEKLNDAAIRRKHAQEYGLQKIWYPPYLPHAGGGTLGIKRSLCKKIGEFDETLPYLHDTDFCFRVQLAGTKLHFVPDAIMHLRQRDTFSGIYRQALNYSKYNVILSKRNRPSNMNFFGLRFWPWKPYIKKWLNLLKLLRYIHDKRTRIRWIWLLGWQIGGLVGSIQQRAYPV